jgi:hypothetical protein
MVLFNDRSFHRLSLVTDYLVRRLAAQQKFRP